LPWSKQQLEEYFLRTNDTVGYASHGVLYPKSDIPYVKNKKNKDELNFGDIIQQRDNLSILHLFASILSVRSQVASTALGLRYDDIVKSKTNKYIYILESLVPQKSYLSNKALIKVGFGEWEDRKPVMPIVVTRSLDKNVILSWDRMASSLDFTMFIIQKSKDKGKTWKRINKLPFLPSDDDNKDGYNPNFNYKDTLDENYVKYMYKVGGLDAFGETVWSDPVEGFGVDLTPPVPPLQAHGENIKDNEVHLSWVNEKENSKDLVGILIGRGPSVNGPFEPLNDKPLPPNQTTFIDMNANPHEANFYVIATIDTAANAALHPPIYVLMRDTIPPTKPLNLEAKIDSIGNVVITWDGYDEPDLLGHQVLFANQKDHVFTVVTEGHLIQPVFYDSISIKTLTKNIYYKVITFDKNYNHSPDSDILEVVKPDIVPPVSPVIKTYDVHSRSISIEWIPSSSTDVKKQHLYRKVGTSGTDYALYKSFDATTNKYEDTEITGSTEYDYTIEAEDATGLRSERSYPLSVKTYNNNKLTGIKNFKAVFNPQTSAIDLKWDAASANTQSPVKYILYKAATPVIEQLKHLDVTSYQDKNIQQSNTWHYAVKAILDDGTESDLSPIITLNIK